MSEIVDPGKCGKHGSHYANVCADCYDDACSEIKCLRAERDSWKAQVEAMKAATAKDIDAMARAGKAILDLQERAGKAEAALAAKDKETREVLMLAEHELTTLHNLDASDDPERLFRNPYVIDTSEVRQKICALLSPTPSTESEAHGTGEGT